MGVEYDTMQVFCCVNVFVSETRVKFPVKCYNASQIPRGSCSLVNIGGKLKVFFCRMEHVFVAMKM